MRKSNTEEGFKYYRKIYIARTKSNLALLSSILKTNEVKTEKGIWGLLDTRSLKRPRYTLLYNLIIRRPHDAH